jgi:hypothetical protein
LLRLLGCNEFTEPVPDGPWSAGTGLENPWHPKTSFTDG